MTASRTLADLGFKPHRVKSLSEKRVKFVSFLITLRPKIISNISTDNRYLGWVSEDELNEIIGQCQVWLLMLDGSFNWPTRLPLGRQGLHGVGVVL